MELHGVIKKDKVKIKNQDDNELFVTKNPVEIEFWDGLHENTDMIQTHYTTCENVGNLIICTYRISDEIHGDLLLADSYSHKNGRVYLYRTLTIEKVGRMKGIRLWYSPEIFPAEEPKFKDLRYFAPPALYDKNDLDGDGLEDYFLTNNLLYREDRLNYPKFMAYSEIEKMSIWIERGDLPGFDSYPERIKDQSMFFHKTDIGSLGVWSEGCPNVRFRAAYPFYEGDATIALYISKTVPFGAFWPIHDGESLSVSYAFGADSQKDFNTACWESIRTTILENPPNPVEFTSSPDEIVRYRLESLDRYYLERPEDEGTPAGYVQNCHPQDGVQLGNIIQYGFTGQNILNAYSSLRYGYENNINHYIEHAIKTADFFANRIHIPETGMFYNLYNADTQEYNFWWTGLLLPLAYARGEELQRLMGPLYENKKDVIERLEKLKGSYLRCMNEDTVALLKLYRYEQDLGRDHKNWFNSIKNYCEFLVRVQEDDGSWYRAYDVLGKPIVHPEIWFGTNIYEKSSSTGSTIPLLVDMYEFTKDSKYIESAIKAGIFVKKNHIERVKYNGGVHDSMYRKGQLIDNESMLYPMFGMLALYKATGEKMFLDGAIDSAHFCASWVCLWDIPLPKDSTLAKYGFRSTGIGACDTCGEGYTHIFQLMCVAELAEIAILSKDKELLQTARLYWHGCNQTVSLPENDWGYKYYGLQEEGYLVSWFGVDDPMFADNTGFGHRWKGEGNKTCFPWISAVGLKGYWELQDRFGTTDFNEIEKRICD